ncbi:unnamed protein product [Darwinula stevensoni]|uniref:Uncharacterized protein n=1 Tax=Darwinula stevensoni TaxID=69355 RepID=A0A7R8X5I1_9CRUS|nr:unnamed protein product [Darwinula stevensoni]CAG0880456.1 unnamed protein product [Darwinula stevensoni]
MKRVGEERVCTRCGGYRMLPCTVCNGSKKSVHRSHRSMEFRTLRCMHCDASGLIRCPDCNT